MKRSARIGLIGSIVAIVAVVMIAMGTITFFNYSAMKPNSNVNIGLGSPGNIGLEVEQQELSSTEFSGPDGNLCCAPVPEEPRDAVTEGHKISADAKPTFGGATTWGDSLSAGGGGSSAAGGSSSAGGGGTSAGGGARKNGWSNSGKTWHHYGRPGHKWVSPPSPPMGAPTGEVSPAIGLNPIIVGELPPQPERSAACIELGIVAADCTDYEGILARLRQAWTAYSCPKRMTKNHGYAVSLVLDPTKPASLSAEEAKKELAPQLGVDAKDVVPRLTKIARYMSATLAGPSFQVEPSGPQKVTVTSAAPVRWNWRVVPTESGHDKQIILTLSVYVGKDETSTSEVQIKTLVERIEVEVSPWDEVLAIVPTAHQGLTLGVTVFTILSAIVAWFNRSSIRGWLKPKAAPPRVKSRRKKKRGTT